MLTSGQCRAARALLEWSQDHLAEMAEVSPTTIANFETNKSAPLRSTLKAIRQAFEAAGIEFTNGDAPGLRLRSKRA
jgi:transcriptional regulator with XRE-family HTH domain